MKQNKLVSLLTHIARTRTHTHTHTYTHTHIYIYIYIYIIYIYIYIEREREREREIYGERCSNRDKEGERKIKKLFSRPKFREFYSNWDRFFMK